MDTITTSTEISDWIVGRIVFYGKVSEDSFDIDTPLTDVGLDSIYALSLCADIEDTYGVEVEPSIYEEFPSIRLLADGLAAQLPAS
jgi:acyl carrier protein